VTEQEQANEASAVLTGHTCLGCRHYRYNKWGRFCATFNEPRSLEGKDANRYGCSRWKSYWCPRWSGSEDTDDDDE